MSTLTRASVARIFARKQNYDLRRLLAGSERTLDRLLDSVERDPGALLLGAVRCVPLARPLRDALENCLQCPHPHPPWSLHSPLPHCCLHWLIYGLGPPITVWTDYSLPDSCCTVYTRPPQLDLSEEGV